MFFTRPLSFLYARYAFSPETEKGKQENDRHLLTSDKSSPGSLLLLRKIWSPWERGFSV